MEYEILVDRGFSDVAPKLFGGVYCSVQLQISPAAYHIINEMLGSGTPFQKRYVAGILKKSPHPLDVLAYAWYEHLKFLFREIFPLVTSEVQIRKFATPESVDAYGLFFSNNQNFHSVKKFLTFELLQDLFGNCMRLRGSTNANLERNSTNADGAT